MVFQHIQDGLHLRDRLAVNQGTHVNTFIEGVADLNLPISLYQRSAKVVIYVFVNNHPSNGCTALAGGTTAPNKIPLIARSITFIRSYFSSIDFIEYNIKSVSFITLPHKLLQSNSTRYDSDFTLIIIQDSDNIAESGSVLSFAYRVDQATFQDHFDLTVAQSMLCRIGFIPGFV